MTDSILICKQRPNNKLVVVDEKRLKTYLDEEAMEVYVIFKRQRHTVQGDCFNGYIVIE